MLFLSSSEPAVLASPPAFPAVFAQELSYVCATLRRLGIPASHVEDLAQDVFVTAYTRFATYDVRRPIRPWLFGIAFRIASAFRNRASVRLEQAAGELPERGEPQPGPDERLAAGQTRAAVLQALEVLDENRRAIFILHEIDGLTIPEAAEVLGIPLNTAYTRLRAARQRFTERFQQLHGRGEA